MTALFIPLKTEYFEAFKAGTKRTEYRVYGPRWNERTCTVGRPVVLSKGYGRTHRLQGEVTAFWKSSLAPADWQKCYGPLGDRLVAHIRIAITSNEQP